MKKLFIILSLLLSLNIAFSQELEFSIENVDEINHTFDVVYTSPVDIYGFQFEISGVSIVDVTDDLDGLFAFDENDVIGFTFSPQSPLSPAGVDIVLVSIEYQFDINATEICIANIVVGGDGSGEGLSPEYNAPDNCYSLTSDVIGLSFGDVFIDMSNNDTTRVLTINYESPVDINGFQLCVEGITLISAENDLNVFIFDGCVVAVHLGGDVLEAGQGDLITLTFDDINGEDGEANLCITETMLVSNDGTENVYVDYEFIDGNCLDVDAVWYDCDGVSIGDALIDDCGVCSGGTSGHEANSDQDDCGICYGDGTTCIIYGDVNGDLELNILDIVLGVSIILNSIEYSPEQFQLLDINGDGYSNVVDLVMMVYAILDN